MAATVALPSCTGLPPAPVSAAPADDGFVYMIDSLVAARVADGSTSFLVSPASTVPSGTLVGTVVQVGTDQPLADVTVGIEGAAEDALTDRNGRFTLSGLAPGRHRLTARRIGFDAGPVTIEVPERIGLTVRVRMSLAGLGHCPVLSLPDGRVGSVWVTVVDDRSGEAVPGPVTLRVGDGVDEWSAVGSDAGPDGQLMLLAGEGEGPFVAEVSAPGFDPWRTVVPEGCPPTSYGVRLTPR